LKKLFQAPAYQIGQKVNFNALSRLHQIDKNAINSYIYISLGNNVVFQMLSFSRNLRKGI